MSDTGPTVNTAECVEIVRALVAAFEAKGQPLVRQLRDEYQPESNLYPWTVEVSTELVERGMKALGMPTPEVPKPHKIPAAPSDAQARALDYLNAYDDARLKSWQGWNYRSFYELARTDGSGDTSKIKLTSGTFEKLRTYKWIVYERKDDGYRPTHYYKLTDAGREVLTRYQVKMGVV